MAAWSVGIDHGLTGALVVLDDQGALVCVVSWREHVVGGRRRQEVVASTRDGSFTTSARSDWELGGIVAFRLRAALPRGALVAVAIEDTYVGKSGKTMRVITRRAGVLAAAVQHELAVEPRWVPAASWRAGMPGDWRTRERSKASAIDLLSVIAPNHHAFGLDVRTIEHVADAAGLASHARGYTYVDADGRVQWKEKAKKTRSKRSTTRGTRTRPTRKGRD